VKISGKCHIFYNKYLVLHPVLERHLDLYGRVDQVIHLGQEYQDLLVCQGCPSDLKFSIKYKAIMLNF